MDLRAWLIDTHLDLRRRLTSSVLQAVPEARWGDVPDGGGSSISWLVLHLVRHHDLALQTAVRNRPPLFTHHVHRLGVDPALLTAGTGLAERDDRAVSATVQPTALMNYTDEVFTATEHWLRRLSAMALDSVPDTARRLTRHAHLDDEFDWLITMWSGRSVQWLVQWPMFGHATSHLGEAVAVRNRLGYSPF